MMSETSDALEQAEGDREHLCRWCCDVCDCGESEICFGCTICHPTGNADWLGVEMDPELEG